ncbi:MAG: DUF481 domain-containing protein [Lentisphaeria bacterium]|nr:DUF481 domain-containing protein [Lentisphaeria bacterium]
MVKKIFSLISFGLFSVCVHADTVEMVDGSRLSGAAKSLQDGQLLFSTTFAGDIRLDWNQVKTLETSVPALAALKAPAPPPPAEEQAKGRTLVYEIAADLAGKEGNVRKMEYGLGASATLAGEADKLKLYLALRKAEVEGVDTENNLTAGVDYERDITETTNWYIRGEYHEDDFKAIDYRTTVAAGLGHYFFQEEKHSLRGRVGLYYQHDEYLADLGSDDSVGLELGLNHVIFANDWVKVVTDLRYLPTFETLDDFDVIHETVVDIPVAGSALWKLRLGVGNEYDSQAAAGREKLDTYYFARLVLNWEHGKFLKASGLRK